MDIVDIKAIYVNHSHFAKSKSKIIVFYDYIALQLLTATHGKMYGTIQQYNGINILYITGLPGLQILLYLLLLGLCTVPVTTTREEDNSPMGHKIDA